MNLKKLFFGVIVLLIAVSCTSDFSALNDNVTVIPSDEVSAKYFITNPEANLYSPGRYPYWRAQLIHADRFAGHFTFGQNGSWWSDELGYSYNGGYTDAAWDWLEGYQGQVDNFIKLTQTGGEFENQYMYATGLIIKGLYFQMFTDTFGEIPYSEAGVEGITLPKYDTQAEIYQGVIAELDEAMNLIGDAQRTGVGVDDLGDNDLFCGGDLQQWKALANTLKLRMGIRAYGSEGASFASTSIQQALNAPLLTSDITLAKDQEIDQFAFANYGDVWHNFGGNGSKWAVGKTLIDYLRDNNDPRLSKYAEPISSSNVTITFTDPTLLANTDKYTDLITSNFDQAGVDYTFTKSSDTTFVFEVNGGAYVGQPERLNGFIKPFVRNEFFSIPKDIIINPKDGSSEIKPEVVMLVADAHLLQAHANLLGFTTSKSAEEHYQDGLRASMEYWQCGAGDIETFISNSDMALLNGTTEQNIEKVAVQRWIAAYTDGFEAWAIVRETGYPANLAAGVSDFDIYGPGTINGDYPQRMRYGSAAYNNNGDNLNVAIGRQGADAQNIKLWWAK